MKFTTKKNSQICAATIFVISADAQEENILVAHSKDSLRKMIAEHIKEGLKKTGEVAWNRVGKHDFEVRVFKDYTYSNYDEEDSEFITYFTKTVVKVNDETKVNTHHKFTKRNPKFVDNPECQFCYKKVVKLHKAHLLDEAKTEKQVCAKCKRELAKMAEIVKTL